MSINNHHHHHLKTISHLHLKPYSSATYAALAHPFIIKVPKTLTHYHAAICSVKNVSLNRFNPIKTSHALFVKNMHTLNNSIYQMRVRRLKKSD